MIEVIKYGPGVQKEITCSKYESRLRFLKVVNLIKECDYYVFVGRWRAGPAFRSLDLG